MFPTEMKTNQQKRDDDADMELHLLLLTLLLEGDDDAVDDDWSGDRIASAAADEGPAFIPLDSPGS